MQDLLNISIVQTELFWEDADKNKAHFGLLIEDIEKGVDIIVLPETFTTGFSMKGEMAEAGSDTVDWMKKIASEKQAAIVGSFFVNEGGKCYNRLHFVEPNGKVSIYNKKHLFCLTNEQETFTAGNKQVVVEYKGWKISLMVCYDLRFPVWMRRTEAHQFDLLLLVANWPERRNLAWKSLLIARAIENQSYVIGANRVGKDGTDMTHSGDSAIIDPMGEYLAVGEASRDMIVHGAIQFSKLDSVRKALPFYKDADRFEL